MLIISQPLLYRALALYDSESDIHSSLHLLGQTLFYEDSHTLASYVCSLSMCWNHWDHRSINDVSGANRKYPWGSIPVLGPQEMHGGTHAYCHLPDGDLAILLDMLPRLQVLIVDMQCWVDAPFSELIKPHNVTLPTDSLPPGLRQLRELHCPCVHPDTLMTVLSLPCMRKINVSIIKLSALDFDTAKAAAGTSAVADLRLQQANRCADQDSLHSPLFLTYILNIPIALTHFALYFNEPPGEMHIRDALQALRGTLQSLDLRIPQLTPPLGSLRGWRSLTFLKCSLVVLLGSESQHYPPRLADMLPRSLRQLHIVLHQHRHVADEREPDWSGAAEVDQEIELVRRKEAVVPLLQTLAVVPRYLVGRPVHGRMYRAMLAQRRLNVACKAVGVQLCAADCGDEF